MNDEWLKKQLRKLFPADSRKTGKNIFFGRTKRNSLPFEKDADFCYSQDDWNSIHAATTVLNPTDEACLRFRVQLAVNIGNAPRSDIKQFHNDRLKRATALHDALNLLLNEQLLSEQDGSFLAFDADLFDRQLLSISAKLQIMQAVLKSNMELDSDRLHALRRPEAPNSKAVPNIIMEMTATFWTENGGVLSTEKDYEAFFKAVVFPPLNHVGFCRMHNCGWTDNTFRHFVYAANAKRGIIGKRGRKKKLPV